jgi:hypothetical protein
MLSAEQYSLISSGSGAAMTTFFTKTSSDFGAIWHMNVIGHNFKRFRELNNMTQEELTAQCNLIGWNFSRGTLAKIESQVRCISAT